MVVTRTIAGGTTVAVRGIPEPDSQYSYAVVLTFEGPLASIAQESVEAGARDVLASQRAVSWVRRDRGGIRIQLTRGDPAFAARVIDQLLAAADEPFDELRQRYDDERFDRALGELEST